MASSVTEAVVDAASSETEAVVDAASIGEPPKTVGSKTETIQFTIYDFEERTESRGKFFESPILKAHGYEWKILVYPRGDINTSTTEEFVSFYLQPIGNDLSITAICHYRCKAFKKEGRKVKFPPKCEGRGLPDFLSREIILNDYLESNDSLVLKCDIRVAEQERRVWFPKKLHSHSVLVDLYEDADSVTSDVVFSVGDVMYRAHRAVFSHQCKKLYEIAQESSNATTPIPILSTSKDAFKSILDFVYTVKTPDLSEETFAIELLAGADLYDCVRLKLYVESILVDKFLRAENAMALLLLADSHSCALLKEAAIELFLTESNTVMKTPDWPKIAESHRLLSELFEALVSFHNRIPNKNTKSKNADELDVTSLREELEKMDLELDGSREVLVKRLNASRNVCSE